MKQHKTIPVSLDAPWMPPLLPPEPVTNPGNAPTKPVRADYPTQSAYDTALATYNTNKPAWDKKKRAYEDFKTATARWDKGIVDYPLERKEFNTNRSAYAEQKETFNDNARDLNLAALSLGACMDAHVKKKSALTDNKPAKLKIEVEQLGITLLLNKQ